MNLPTLRSSDALLIVDVQRDFCPGGALAVPDRRRRRADPQCLDRGRARRRGTGHLCLPRLASARSRQLPSAGRSMALPLRGRGARRGSSTRAFSEAAVVYRQRHASRARGLLRVRGHWPRSCTLQCGRYRSAVGRWACTWTTAFAPACWTPGALPVWTSISSSAPLVPSTCSPAMGPARSKKCARRAP